MLHNFQKLKFCDHPYNLHFTSVGMPSQVDLSRPDFQRILHSTGILELNLDDTTPHKIPQAGEPENVQVHPLPDACNTFHTKYCSPYKKGII